MWQGEPAGTKSFLVTVYDPYAPTGSGWWHWVVVNIPAKTHSLSQNAGNNQVLLPDGSEAISNDFGHKYYGGPCPPEGRRHRYQFTVYALSVEKLGLPATATPALVGFMANANLLGKATMTYYYQR